MNTVVDVHSHLYPPAYVELLRSRDRRPRVCTVDGDDRFILFPDEDDPQSPGGRPLGESFWSIAAKVAYMAAAGIDRSVVSVGNPWLDAFAGRESLAYAAELNELMAGLEGTTGGRLVGLGVLPNADVAHAAGTVRDLAADGRLPGFITGGRICGLSLDDPRLEPLWSVTAGAGLVWFLHPAEGVAVDTLSDYAHVLPVALGFPFETTIALARLLLAGVLARHPDLKLLVAHGGGAMPCLAGRLDAVWGAYAGSATAPSTALRHVYFDAVTYDARTLGAALDLSSGKLLFGTDHPFDVADAARQLAVIRATVDADTSERICARTATTLFGLSDSDPTSVSLGI